MNSWSVVDPPTLRISIERGPNDRVVLEAVIDRDLIKGICKFADLQPFCKRHIRHFRHGNAQDDDLLVHDFVMLHAVQHRVWNGRRV